MLHRRECVVLLWAVKAWCCVWVRFGWGHASPNENDRNEIKFKQWLRTPSARPNGFSLLDLTSPLSPSHLHVCCSVQLARFSRVHFPLTHITILITGDSWWAEISLRQYWRSVDPTGACVRQIILVVKLAQKQPGSRGWLDSYKLAGTLWSRGSPVSLADWDSWPGGSRHGCYALACSTEK